MCYPKPGPRCSNHAKQSLDSAKKALMKAKKEGNKNMEQVAIIDLKNAMNDYDSTPAGQADLVNKIEETKSLIEIGDSGGINRSAMESRLDSYEKRKATGELKREIAMEQYKAMNHPNGNVDYNGKVLYKDDRGFPHREDGPAYIGPDGAKEWFKHGEFHREDGPAIIDKDGGEHYYVNGKLHREDGPATSHPDKGEIWYKNGDIHRDGGPAMITKDGTQQWFQNSKRHREDGPAVIQDDGKQFYYINGRLHRENGPAVFSEDGYEEWYQKGKRHRDDGPARIKADGTQEWFQNGERHREGGPAVTKPDGRIEYWDHGKYLGYKDPRI